MCNGSVISYNFNKNGIWHTCSNRKHPNTDWVKGLRYTYVTYVPLDGLVRLTNLTYGSSHVKCISKYLYTVGVDGLCKFLASLRKNIKFIDIKS